MIKILKSPLVLIFSLYLNSAYACVEGEKGCDVNKRDWLEFMKYRLPPSLCSNDFPFLKCTDISKQECEEFTTKAVEICIANNDKNIPKFLNRIESRDWGEILGDCAGKKLFNHVEFKENKDASCRELLQVK